MRTIFTPAAFLIIVVGALLCSCGGDRRIDLDSALRSTSRGDFNLIVFTDQFISFQRDGHHKYQYYFTPPLPQTVVDQIKSAADQARSQKHEVDIEDSRASAGNTPGKQPEPTVDRLLRVIRAELPEGWTASYDKEGSWLKVSRDEPVLSFSALPNRPAGGEKPERRTFVFAFHVAAVVHPAEYHRLRAENAKIQEKVTALYKELVRKKVSGKFDDFLPSTDEEKASVAQYETLKESLHPLPDFYFNDISLEWGFNSPVRPIISVTDDHLRDECKGVQEKVIKLLSKYDAA